MKPSKIHRHYRSFPRLFTASFRHTFLLATLCSLGLIFTSCGSDSPTDPGGNGGNGGGNGGGGDPPTEPTYANVQSIFSSSCALSGCHNSQTQRSGVNLSSYDGIINSVGDQYGENVVQAGNAENSPLVDKIESDSPEHGVRMPQTGPPYLSDDQIDLIKEWINDGANEDEETNNGGNSGGGNSDY